MLVFDASQSMAAADADNKGLRRIDSVRTALARILPRVARRRRLGLISYGPGSRAECDNIGLALRPQLDAAARIQTRVNALNPAGRTPLTRAVRMAAETLSHRDRPATIVLLTDGEESCNGAPCALAKALKARSAHLTVHVISYRIKGSIGSEGIFRARCLADETGGLYVAAETVDELAAALEKVLACPFVSERPRPAFRTRSVAAIKSRSAGSPSRRRALFSDVSGRPSCFSRLELPRHGKGRCASVPANQQPATLEPSRMRNSLLALGAYLLSVAGAVADCTSEVNDAFAKLRKQAAFNMQTTITNAEGTLTMSNDYVLPDRMHQRISLSTQDAGGMEMILIGDKAWSNQGQHGWAPLPPNFIEKIARQMKETVAEPPKDTSEFECLGDVELEGKTYAAYRTKRPAAAEGRAGPTKAAAETPPNVQTVYVDKHTGLPARNIVTPETEPEKRLFDGTFTLREGLKIEPPQS